MFFNYELNKIANYRKWKQICSSEQKWPDVSSDFKKSSLLTNKGWSHF